MEKIKKQLGATYTTHWEKVIELIIEELNRCAGESLAEVANDLGVFSPTGEIQYVGDSMFEVKKSHGTEQLEQWEERLHED